MIIEKGYSLKESFIQLCKNINSAGVGSGLVAPLFSTLSPELIVMNAANQGGLKSSAAHSREPSQKSSSPARCLPFSFALRTRPFSA